MDPRLQYENVCFNVNITELICAKHEPHATEEITKMLGVHVGQ